MATPEKLSLWDRWFNRYRKEIVEEGYHIYSNTWAGNIIQGTEHRRRFVKYRIIDRVTGSERIELEYLT